MQEQNSTRWKNRFKWLLAVIIAGFWFYTPQNFDKSSKKQSYVFERIIVRTDSRHCQAETTAEHSKTMFERVLNILF